jgi:hypothetical protein
MKRWWILGCVLALGLGLTACDDDDDDMMMEDGGTTPEEDAGDTMPMTMGVLAADPSGGMVTTSPADFACRGMNAAPTGGDAVTFTGLVEDFFNGMPVEGLTVQFFPNNMPSTDGTCADPCVEVTSDGSGNVELTAPEGGWYAYRVEAGEGLQAGTPADYIEAVQSNVVVPAAGGTENLIAVSSSTRNTILNLLGVMQEPGTATITGQVFDCTGLPVANAQVRLFDEGGEIDLGTGSTGPRAFYFNGDSFPSAPQRMTNTDGLYGAANVPIPANDTVRVEIWGALTDGGEMELLGCEETVAIADGITVINIDPLRSDAPAACGSGS